MALSAKLGGTTRGFLRSAESGCFLGLTLRPFGLVLSLLLGSNVRFFSSTLGFLVDRSAGCLVSSVAFRPVLSFLMSSESDLLRSTESLLSRRKTLGLVVSPLDGRLISASSNVSGIGAARDLAPLRPPPRAHYDKRDR